MEEYDLKKIQQLLKDFYNLTNIKICLYDGLENEISYYPEKYSSFCRTLRKDPEKDALCRKCDKNAFNKCKMTGASCSYTCHAGLLESFSPIIHDGEIIGYVVIGQIRPEKDDPRPEDMTKELKELYENLPKIPLDKINSAINVLDACAGYAYLKKLVDLERKGFETKIVDYIRENLTEDLSVNRLCQVFHLSRVELYSVFKKYFDETVLGYIKKARLEKACLLLRETSLPVYEIAAKVGIPDYNYFSKNFKKAYGISPRAMRKKR